MAKDQVELMQATWASRGSSSSATIAAAASRIGSCLDHPDAVERVAVLDISPTALDVRQAPIMAFATAYYHWFFLIQPFDLPERLIGADPVYYLRSASSAGWGSGLTHFDPRALAEYERCFRDPGDDPRDLRGLSRRGVDRSRARCRGRARPRGVPAARAVGR